MRKKGKFIVIDGLNGCGKGTAVDYAKKYFNDRKIFDLRQYMKDEHRIPDIEEIVDYDIILSCEPTNCWVGEAIRKEMFFDNNRDYTGYEMLTAFALDRLILYKRLLIPFRDFGKIIIQERTISTTLIQQPVHKNKPVSIQKILNHPLHKYTLGNLPDLFLIIEVDPVQVSKWLNARDKKDNDIYEYLEMQKQFAKRWKSKWFAKIFTDRNSNVEYLLNDSTLPVFINKIDKFYQTHFPKR